MSNEKQTPLPRSIRGTSPKMVFKYPKLKPGEPDYGNDTYPDPAGSYKTKGVMVLASDEAQAFIAKLTPLHDATVAAAKKAFKELPVATRKKLGDVTVNPLYGTIYDAETEEETGEIEFNFKMKASGINKKTDKKWERSPQIFDSFGREIHGDAVPDIWGGTVGKVSFEAVPYFIKGTGICGVSLKLKAAQLIELVSGGGGSASSHGFGEEEGGFAYNDDDFAPRDTDADEDQVDDDGPAAAEDDGDF